MAPYDVNGRVALITGGARGIGFATGEALARRGASVALVDLDGGQVAAAAGRLGRERAVGLVADVTDPDAIDRAVAAAVERFGGVDIVIANAGIAPSPGPVRMIPAEEWERVVEVNLLGVYRTVRAGLEQVISSRGQMVVVSSAYAFMNGSMASPYAVAKAGVEQLGRALALELSVHGASATVAYFGWVDTRMVQDAFEERRRMTGHDEELLPGFLMKRITPAQAGEALARGIERRAPRVLAPRWWAAASALRGVLGPLMDAAGTRSERVQQALREAEEGAAAHAGERAGAQDPASGGGEAGSEHFGSS